jgi:hypothetical protein
VSYGWDVDLDEFIGLGMLECLQAGREITAWGVGGVEG